MTSEGLILEGIVTTMGCDGRVNISPMGPRVAPDMRRLTLRPFRTSRTYKNLKVHGEGVFHVTDDVELLARSAVGDVEAELRPARVVSGFVLAGACRAHEFRVSFLDDTGERTSIEAEVVHSENLRDYFGLNRAKHAVVEAAILATRLHLVPLEEILSKLRELDVLVKKTGGAGERRAFDFLMSHVASERNHRNPARVRVVTGSRLHFGLISPGSIEGRKFGGAGLMVARPSIDLSIERSERPEATGPLAERTLGFAKKYTGESSPRYRLRVAEAPRDHTGLGTGTQLGLAVARAIATIEGNRLSAVELAASMGRGLRSAIGVHGFEHGGFIADGGRGGSSEAIAPLLCRLEVPEDWRFVLAAPIGGLGISGNAEDESFRFLDASSEESAHALCHALFLGMAPALAEKDIHAFGDALYEYGVKSGECFKKAQGGVFASVEIAEIVEFLRSEGVRGAGQSSWGPTVYAVTDGDGRAGHTARRIANHFGPDKVQVIVTRPLNRGAEVSRPEDNE